MGKSTIRCHCRSVWFCAGYYRVQQWHFPSNYITKLCVRKKEIYILLLFFFFFFLKCLKFVSWIILINIHILVITSCLGTSDEQQMIMFSMKSPNIHFSFVLLVCFEARSTCKLYSHYGIRLLISWPYIFHHFNHRVPFCRREPHD